MPQHLPSTLAALPYAPPADDGLDIVYRDASLLLVNKPAGLLAVPGRGDGKDDCLLRRVQAVVADALIVHRLDLHTSGLLLLARGREMQRRLAGDLGWVGGPLPAARGEIDLPLAADWPRRPRQRVDRLAGKPALTRYQVLGHDPASNRSRLALFPETGRTHQLRVHLQALGHAIVGDLLYGDASGAGDAGRLLLHADQLRFIHPASGRLLCVDSPAPF